MPKESLQPRLGANFREYTRLKARLAEEDVGEIVGEEHTDKWKVIETRSGIYGRIVSLLNETPGGILQIGFDLRRGGIFVKPDILEPDSESVLTIAPEPYIKTPGNPEEGGGVNIAEKDSVLIGEDDFDVTSDFSYGARGSLNDVEFLFSNRENRGRWIHSEIGARKLAEMQRRHRGLKELCGKGSSTSDFFGMKFSVAGGDLSAELIQIQPHEKETGGRYKFIETGVVLPVVPLRVNFRKPGDLFKMVRDKVRMLGGDIIK